MYRLSITGTANKIYLSQMKDKKHIKQRVYRWENKWGYLRKDKSWDESWSVEERSHISFAVNDENTFLLELCIPLSISPPVNIDDVWEEEVICDKTVTCNSILSITGSKQDLIQFCARYAIQIPILIMESIHV